MTLRDVSPAPAYRPREFAIPRREFAIRRPEFATWPGGFAI